MTVAQCERARFTLRPAVKSLPVWAGRLVSQDTHSSVVVSVFNCLSFTHVGREYRLLSVTAISIPSQTFQNRLTGGLETEEDERELQAPSVAETPVARPTVSF